MGAIFDNKVSEVIFSLVETDIQFAPVVSSIVIQNDAGESQDSPDSNMSGSNESCEIQVGSENNSGSMKGIKNKDSGSKNHEKKRKSKVIKVFDSDDSDYDSIKNSMDENRIQDIEDKENLGKLTMFLDSDDSEAETRKKIKRSYHVESDDSDKDDKTEKGLVDVDKNHSETIKADSLIQKDTNNKTNSDSEVASKNNKCATSIQERNNVNNKKIIFQTCSDSEKESKNNFKKSKISDIVDSETSEEETQANYDLPNQTENSLRTKKVNHSSKKMTGKEALEQRREIKSESQRMLRESRISIPYHKPKTRTIKEFFKNRPRISDPIPDSVKSLSPSVAIKVATSQLQVLSERLQAREKIVKEFYKSESDSDTDNTKNVIMEADEINLKHLDVDKQPNQNELVQNKDVIFDNVGKDNKHTGHLDVSKDINGEKDLNKESRDEKNIMSFNSCLSTSSNEKCSINETQISKSKVNYDLNENQSLALSEKSDKNRVSVSQLSGIESPLKESELEKNNDMVITNVYKKCEVLEDTSFNSQQKNDIRKSNLIQSSIQITNISSVNSREKYERDTESNKKDIKCDRAVLNNISITFKDLFDSMNSDITVSQLKEELLKSFTNPSNLVKQKQSNLYSSLKESQMSNCFVDVNLIEKNYSNTVEEFWNKSGSHNLKTGSVSSESAINLTTEENDEETDFVNSLFNSSDNDLKLVQESTEILEKMPSKTRELNEKQSQLSNQTDDNSNSNESVLNCNLLSQNIPKLTNSQMDNLKECEIENNKNNIWNNLNAFSELDSENENDSGKINRLKNDQTKIPVENDIKHVSIECIQPKLTGGPNTVIDLDEDVSKPKGMNTLMKRYMNHVIKKQSNERKLELKVISAEGGQIREDKVIVPVSKVDDTGAGSNFEKPGVKLMRLKGDLKQQIMQKRSEEWAKKEQELKMLHGEDEELEDEDDVYKDEKDDCCEDRNDTKEINNEGCDSEDVDEEELVKDDIEMKENSRQTKSVFINEEADEEEEDEKDFENDVETEENEDSEEENELEEIEDSDESENYEGDCEENDKYDSKTLCGVKKLRRIKAAFEDDSDSDTEIEKMKKAAEEAVDRAIDCTDTLKKSGDIPCNDIDVFDVNDSDCEDEIPVHQRTMQCTPITLNTSKSLNMFQSKSDNSFVSPVLKLTALQGMSSVTKHNTESPEISQFFLSSDPSPLRDGKSAKRLFSDVEPENSQENYDELMNLCSGKFTTQNCVISTKENKIGPLTERSQWLNNSNILADNKNKPEKLLCNQEDDDELKSVLVGGLSLSADIIDLDKDDIEETSNNSQSFKLVWLEDSDNDSKDPENSCSKKSVQSPLPSNDVDVFQIMSSTEEENQTNTVKRNKKFTKKMKLKFSDDDHSDSENETDQKKNFNEEIEDDNENVEDEEDEIDYDSEENEVVVNKKTKATDFFEKEAELSESDWDSADEDEKGLDEFEREEGDDDDLDQKKVRNELERIHMRRVLDDDHREVRMLQEILFEDGELHSESGRKRQFKWRNIDDVGVDENAPPEDDADNIVYDEEEDTEEHWRRMRHEREKFLEEKRIKLLRNNNSQDLLDLELEDDESQIMKLGQAALRRSISTSQTKTNVISNGVTVCQTETVISKSVTIKSSTNVMSNIADIKKPFTLVNKRGSFLTRGENALARLAAITKDSSEMPMNSLKSTRNFVFTTVDPVEKLQPTSEIVEKQAPSNKGKRKANVDGTPTILKKLKVADSLARSNSNSRVNKLFDAM